MQTTFRADGMPIPSASAPMKLVLIILGVFVGTPSLVSYYLNPSPTEAIFIIVSVGVLILAFSGEEEDPKR